MPKTPPLIIPNNIPNDWINRSKINKSNNKVKNIFAAQNKKQLRFEETEELQFTDNYEPASEIGHSNFTQQSEHQSMSSPPHQTASDVFYFTPLNQQNNNQSQSSFKHSQQPQDQCKSMSQQRYMNTDAIDNEKKSKMDVDLLDKSSQGYQVAAENNEPFNSTLIDISSEFQQFMEEHRQIKKSIESKRKELEQFTQEQMLYLDERQTYFQSRMKSLKDFY